MKRAKSILGFVGQIVLLTAMALAVIFLLGRLAPLQPLAGQPVSSPTDSLSSDPGYPPPGDPTVEPTPQPSVTPATTIIYTTITPVPITPYPTLTLKPGPSATPIPIKEPAKDASGTIFFIAKETQAASSAIYSMGMDAAGNKADAINKISVNEFPQGDLIFPSPNGKYLAVVGRWGILSILNTETGALEKAAQTSIGDAGIFFNWFPDNQRILWDAGSLALSDPFSGEYTVLVVPGYGRIWEAAVSPDGQYVVYEYSTDVIYPKGLWIVNTNGQDAHLLVKGINPSHLSWSPDGKQIAFYGYGWQIVDADGSNLREVAPGVIIPHCYPDPPRWSPDSRSLAVVTSQSGEALCQGWTDEVFKDTNIVLIDVESGKAHPLLPDGSTGNIDPAWSPDGSQIAFISNRGGTPGVWAVNADGQNLRQMTEGYQMVRHPLWRRPSKGRDLTLITGLCLFSQSEVLTMCSQDRFHSAGTGR